MLLLLLLLLVYCIGGQPKLIGTAPPLPPRAQALVDDRECRYCGDGQADCATCSAWLEDLGGAVEGAADVLEHWATLALRCCEKGKWQLALGVAVELGGGFMGVAGICNEIEHHGQFQVRLLPARYNNVRGHQRACGVSSLH